ncbi:MAG: hypothetical protein ACE5HI_04310 [bacterium]
MIERKYLNFILNDPAQAHGRQLKDALKIDGIQELKTNKCHSPKTARSVLEESF